MTDTLTPEQRLELARLVGLDVGMYDNGTRVTIDVDSYSGGVVRTREWAPDTDWRDTGKVLEWLRSQSDRITFEEIDTLDWACTASVTGGWVDGVGKTLQLAICLAALAVGGEG